MPCTKKKNPIFKHKDDQWNWDSVHKHADKFGDDKYQAILLKNLIVIDFDDKKLARKYESLFEILQICPKVSTKKGYHYYFKRTGECDLYALYDKARCFGVGNEEIDFKTICSTGTAGVVVIPPSPDKRWVRNLWSTPIPYFDGEIFDHFEKNWKDKKYKLPKEIIDDVVIYDNIEDKYDTNVGDEYFNKIALDDQIYNDIKKFINNLNVKRSEDYPTWIEVLWCLRNISAGYVESNLLFKKLWLEFSEKCPSKYNKEKSTRLWNKTVPRINGLKYGTLIYWYKKDNPHLFIELDDNDKIIIKDFIVKNFLYGKSKISDICVKDYDNNKLIFANINESMCKHIKDEHDKPSIFIIISNNEAVEKCRECDLILNKVSLFPEDLIEITNRVVGKKELSPEKSMTNFIKENNSEMYGNIDLKLSPPFMNELHDQLEYDIENNHCCNPDCKHDLAHNKVLVKTNKKKYCIYCLVTHHIHPDRNGSIVPDNIYPSISNININIINNINNGTINNNNINCDEKLLMEDFVEDNLPFYRNDDKLYVTFLMTFSSVHGYVANFVYAIWNEEFRYFNKNWYQFENHIWRLLDEPVLSHRLSHDFCDIYNEVKDYYRRHPILKNGDKKIKQIDTLISNLNNTNFKNSVMSQCQENYQVYNKGFNEKINKANILPFNNGVIDLDTMEFRDGKPDDAMTMSTNIDYIKYDPHNVNGTMSDILKFIDDIMPIQTVKEYLLNVSAICLTRYTKTQSLWILTGGGSNGKTIYMNLLSNTLGDFSVTGTTELITRKAANANEANESLSCLNNVRHVVFNEPGDKDVIQSQIIKVMTGGRDKFSTRGNYEKQSTFLPVLKPMILCNMIPRLSEDHYSTWRRIKIIHFPMKYCEDPDPTIKYEKSKDDSLDEKSDNWGKYFAGYLIYLLNILKENNFKLIEPDEVVKKLNEYKDDNDEYKDFRDSYIIKSDDDYIQWNTLKTTINKWLKFKNKPLLDGKGFKILKKYFEEKLGKFSNTTRNHENVHGFMGWSLKADYIL